MLKDYYISNLQLHVDSDIPLDEYEAEKKFETNSLPILYHYQVRVKLTDQIMIPDRLPDYTENFREWNCEEYEIRAYPFYDVTDAGIVSCYRNNEIDICVRKDLWGIYMHSFRIWSYIFLERILLKSNALILHSASIQYKGCAVLFTAPSETGKTTQTDIWHRNNPSVTDLNGDRTILQWNGREWMACGIPISGTSTRCEQAAVPIQSIVIVNRASEDSVSQLSPAQKISFLYGQITVFSYDSGDADKVLNLLENLINQVKILQLNCTMKDSAYNVLCKELYGEEM